MAPSSQIPLAGGHGAGTGPAIARSHGAMKVVRWDRADGATWNAFVAQHPDASFYHRFEWQAINERALGHESVMLAATDGGRIRGIFPIVHVKSTLFGNIVCSMPFVNYGGPVSDSPEVEALLLDEARRACDAFDADYLEIRSRREVAGDLALATHKVSVTLDLDADSEVIWKGFKTGHRQEIRRGYKRGAVARCGGVELLDDFLDVLGESFRNLGTPLYGRNYFAAILEAFPRSTRLCVVYVDGKPAAAAFDGLHGDTVEGMWLGTKAEFRPMLVGYVLYWELIKDACERGYKRFHLGRSTAESGGEAFKKKWNASSLQLYWQYYLRRGREIPGLNVNNPRYQAAIALWRRLPIGVTRFLGPSIARNIP